MWRRFLWGRFLWGGLCARRIGLTKRSGPCSADSFEFEAQRLRLRTRRFGFRLSRPGLGLGELSLEIVDVLAHCVPFPGVFAPL